MSMIPKRLLATAALGAALASTSIGETRAMQIPVTTANAIASPALTEPSPMARLRLARLRLAWRWMGRWRRSGGPYRGRADRRSRSSALLWL